MAHQPTQKKLGIVKMYLLLLPLSALVASYVLLASRATAFSEAELAQMRFGWPFTVVEQDLSRYMSSDFPVTMEFHWQRNWSDPIATHYDLLAFAMNTLLLGVAVTGCFFGIVSIVRALVKRRQNGE